jgi:hypothetical protein
MASCGFVARTAVQHRPGKTRSRALTGAGLVARIARLRHHPGKTHFLIELISPQPDILELFIAHSLQNPSRLLP